MRLMKTRYLAELVVAVLLITGGIITPARAAAGTQDGALVGVSRPAAAPGGSNSWSWRGPQFNSQVGEAPEVIQVVFDVVNSNTIWATTNQGVYLSQDGGESWEPRNHGLSGYGDLVVTDLLQDPSNPGQLTISTWDTGCFTRRMAVLNGRGSPIRWVPPARLPAPG
jgi:hypothetical protein